MTRRFVRGIDVKDDGSLVTIGDPAYGGWTIPEGALEGDSVCYLAGVGTDVSFDRGLIERYGCTVHAFDPVPAAVEVGEATDREVERFHFHPIGLWSEDTTLNFHAPRAEGFVSYSATNMHETESGFDATVRSVDSLMREFGHDSIDLLKLSVEGSEHEIVADVVEKSLPVHVICIELAQPSPLGRSNETVRRLEAAGYALVHASTPPWNWKLTFSRAARG